MLVMEDVWELIVLLSPVPVCLQLSALAVALAWSVVASQSHRLQGLFDIHDSCLADAPGVRHPGVSPCSGKPSFHYA